MADCIDELITNDLETTLEATSILGAVPGAVERERTYLLINNRYPFVEIQGPFVEVDTQTYEVAMSMLGYLILVYVKHSDEEVSEDEITRYARNVAADVIKGLMVDPTRGNNALITKITERGYGFGEGDDTIDFFVYVGIEITAREDSTDPYSLG